MAKGKYEEWLTPEGLLKLEGWATDGLTDEQIAENMSIDVRTLYRWKKQHCQICQSLKKSKEIADRQVENALFKRALGFEYKEITQERIQDTGQKVRHGGQQQELTEREWQECIRYFQSRCCYCGKETALTKDHVVALDAGGILTRENVIPCCRKCNSSKKNHNMTEWYREQPFFEEKRLNNILLYLHQVSSQSKEADEGELLVTKIVTKTVLPDTTAQIFWLKNRKASKWAERSQRGMKIDELNPSSIGKVLAGTLEMLASGDMDNKTAGTIISGYNAILSSIRTDEQQRKIDELERILNETRQKP